MTSSLKLEPTHSALKPPPPTEIEQKPWLRRTAIKTWEVCRWILKTIAGLALLATHTSFFVTSFIFGFTAEFFNIKVKATVDKIIEIMKKMHWALFIPFGIGALIVLPITLVTAAITFGAYSGSSFALYIQKNAKQQETKKLQK